jgi:hypothetical protein
MLIYIRKSDLTRFEPEEIFAYRAGQKIREAIEST